jgi:isopenicillin N synthase-like dioxygenase
MSVAPAFDLADFEAATGPRRHALAAALDRACRETGFLTVAGHGVPDAIIAAVRDAAARFFDQSPEEKARAAPPRPGAPYGWLGPGTEALARSKGKDTPPDLKESFNGGPAAVPAGLTDPQALALCYSATPWPDLQGFRAAWTAYYAAMEALAARVMAAFVVALGLPAEFFAAMIDRPISALRALHYPATDRPPAEGQQRAGAHTDYGSLTILLPDAQSRGLEVMSGGRWVEVVPVEGSFVVNLGDLMARWTNDRWASTLHRVVVPPEAAGRRRMSLAFFHQPNWDAEIVNLTDAAALYPPVRSGPYLMSKFAAATA